MGDCRVEDHFFCPNINELYRGKTSIGEVLLNIIQQKFVEVVNKTFGINPKTQTRIFSIYDLLSPTSLCWCDISLEVC